MAKSKTILAFSVLIFIFLLLPHRAVRAQDAPPPASSPETHSATPTITEIPSVNSLKKMSLVDLMNINVTSVSRQPEPYEEAPAAINVITNDEIRRSGASSIPEALRLADNLEVAQQNSNTWDITARGFNTGLANKLLVLMDGRTVYSPLDSGVFWNAQDYLLEDIDRIEVISGPGGTLWGANAVNGVINIVSKDAKDTQGGYVEEGGGIGPYVSGGIRYGGILASNIYYRYYGKYFNRGNEVFPDGGGATDSWRMGQGGFRIDDENDSRNKFTLQGDIYDSAVSNTAGDGESAGGNVLGRWSHTISEDSDLSLQLYYDQTYFSDPKPPLFVGAIPFPVAPAGIFTDNLNTYDLDFQHHFHLDGNNNFIWGLGYRLTHDVVVPAPSLTFVPNTLDHSLYSVFAQDEFKLTSDLSLTAGSKVEHNDYTGYEFEPSGRLKWNLTETQMLWAAVSRAVRMPSRIDRDIEETTPALIPFGIPVILAGGSNFESETVIAYELGYRAQWTPDFSSSISSFFNNYDDIRSAAFSTPPAILGFPVVFGNGLEAQTAGIELTADFQPMEGWRLHAGYDLLEENAWVKPGATDINNALNETADPKNQVFFRSSMDLPGEFEFDPAFRWVDSLIYNNNGRPGIVPSYAELDVRLSWHPHKDIEISITGQNLLHDYHLEYVASSPFEEIQRNVYGEIACQF